MRSLGNLSIKRKLTWIIMLTSGIALLLACLAFIVYDRVTFKDSMVRDLMTMAEGIQTIKASGVRVEEVKNVTPLSHSKGRR